MDDVEHALEELYRHRYARFEAVLTTVTRDREAARDAVQEAFAVALARKRQFRGDGSLEGWVWKIALRQAAGRSGPRNPVAERLDPVLPELELDSALAAAIRCLSARRRLFVFLRYFGDLTYEQIAQACGVSRGTVAAALARARAQLACVLEDEIPTSEKAR